MAGERFGVEKGEVSTQMGTISTREGEEYDPSRF